MPKLKIEGGHKLSGDILISGAKNSAVALLPASLLCTSKSKIVNLPKIRDIEYLLKILKVVNCDYKIKENIIEVYTTNLTNNPIPEHLSEQMRASYYFMGTLLARFKHIEISFPGGCNIGARPIDLHIKGFEALGATVTIIKNKYIIDAKELKGTTIHLDFPSVGATINLMLASSLAKGTTIIENAACEPEIGNVIDYLISMGLNIEGKNTNRIVIKGASSLDNGFISVCPDRIEASTYVILGALIGNNLKIKGINTEFIKSLLDTLKTCGVNFKELSNEIIISKCNNIKPIDIKTEVYPGFPTDTQPPFVTLLTQANGTSIITETIYESRFKFASLLNEMGANTESNGNILKVTGPTKLSPKTLYTPDLRGGAALVLAALITKGTTYLDNISLILRGYEDIVEKLTKVGAKISVIE